MQRKPLMLDDWQKEILEAKGDIILCTGRQVGKTTIFAIKAAEEMVKKPGIKILAQSLTEDQAKVIVIMILTYLEQNHKHMIAKKKHKPTQNKVTLTNGSQFLVRPVGATGDAMRGFTGDILYIDEAARMPELVWAAARPVLLTTAGRVWLSSTPHGKTGYFWEAFQNKNNRYKVFHISSEEVIRSRPISDSWSERQRVEALKFLENEKKEMSELRYGQEYLGLFLDELRQYFPDTLIESCCTLKRRASILKGRSYFLGVDIARMGHDESTFEILDKINENTIEQVENLITKKTLTTQTESLIVQLATTYDYIETIAIDAGSGSLGVGIFDHLLNNEVTRRRIMAINNNARPLDREGKSKAKLLKEDLYDNLRSMMEKGSIKLLDDPEIKLSLKSVQYEYVTSPNGETRLKIFGNYTHIVEGIIRAAYPAKGKDLNLWIRSIKV